MRPLRRGLNQDQGQLALKYLIVNNNETLLRLIFIGHPVHTGGKLRTRTECGLKLYRLNSVDSLFYTLISSV